MIDKLERDLRAANPLTSRCTDPLSARAEADLARILAEAPSAVTVASEAPAPLASVRRRRATRAAWALAAVAAVTTGIVIAATSLTVSPEVSVAAPPALEATPIDATLSEVIEELTAKARALPGDTDPAQTIETEGWSAALEFGNDNSLTNYFVQPENVLRVRAADLSGFIEVTAGEVRWGDTTAPQIVPPGELIIRSDYAAGEFPILYPQPAPDTGAALYDYIQATVGYDDSTPTGLYFTALRDVRLDWATTGPQAAAVLELVGTLPDVELLGEVTDRLGRTGIAVSTEMTLDDTVRNVLVFDPTTGNLLSNEITYLGGSSGLDIPVGSVMQYLAWKEP